MYVCMYVWYIVCAYADVSAVDKSNQRFLIFDKLIFSLTTGLLITERLM